MTDRLWLDHVVALPTVVFEFKAWFRGREWLLTELSPLMETWSADRTQITFQEAGPLGLRIERKGDCKVEVNPTAVRLAAAPAARVGWDP